MFYLTGPNVVHYQEADPYEPMDELCLHIDIVELGRDASAGRNAADAGWGMEWEYREAEECVKQLQQMKSVPLMDQYNAMQWFLTAYRAWHDNEPCFLTTIKHSIVQILLRAARVFAVKQPPVYMPSRDMNAYRYQLATQFIQDNYASPITLEQVAERVHISGRHLQRIFREQSSESFSEYLENVRLSRVCTQLLQSDLTMEQIAAENGFASSNYLFYVFKKRFHMTPKQYRQLHGV
jgi:AraC-like DNA-binding protein